MRPLLLVPVLVTMFAATALADTTTPGSVAALVRVPSGAAIVEPLTAALTDPAPLVRATAARVAAVRDAKVLIPVLRTAAISRER